MYENNFHFLFYGMVEWNEVSGVSIDRNHVKDSLVLVEPPQIEWKHLNAYLDSHSSLNFALTFEHHLLER